MFTQLSPEVAAELNRQRRSDATAAGRAARLVSARRWQRRAEQADRRARLARLAVR